MNLELLYSATRDAIRDIAVPTGRRPHDEQRAALAELMKLWRWASGRKRFGEKFDHFAETAMSEVFGWQENGFPNLAKERESISADMNAHPDRYIVHYLNPPKKTG